MAWQGYARHSDGIARRSIAKAKQRIALPSNGITANCQGILDSWPLIHMIHVMQQVALAVILLLLLGCKSPEHTALVATTAVTQTADAAIGAFNDWRKTNPVSTEDILRVRKLAQQYKTSVEAARVAQNAYVVARGTGDETGARDAYSRALDALEVIGASYVRLIYAIAPELQKQQP